MHRHKGEMALLLQLLMLGIYCISSAAPQDASESSSITSHLREINIKLVKLEEELRKLQTYNGEQQLQNTQLQQQVTQLEQQLQLRKVAFTVSLVDSTETTTIGPFNKHTPLVFKKVIENIGNAYNLETGLFTAPVKGVYHFELHVHGIGHTTYGSGASLMKNDQHICVAYGFPPASYVNASNGATLLLEVGDVVFLRLWENSKIYDSVNHHTTFSGHMLYTM